MIGKPCYRITLTTACRMFYKVIVTWTMSTCVCCNLAYYIELMESGKNHAFFFEGLAIYLIFVHLQMQEPADYVKPAIPLPYIFPEIRCPVSIGIDWIALTPIAAKIKGHVTCLFTFEFCGHVGFIGINCKVYQRSLFELEQKLIFVSVKHELLLGIVNTLTCELVLQFYRSHR